MYEAPKFVKVHLNIDESFSTYDCEYISDGEAFWLYTNSGCKEYYYESGTDISGSVAEFASYECWISPTM